ncbi:MAG: hypothetical protein HUK24_03780 [Sphaerochaetaceae bacterium]|nr:hypothetical protein [Sphaerochaetaceae bacterium]
MAKLLKALGYGALYTLLSPFILAFFALYFVYCVFAFLYMAIRNLIVFFAGGNPMGDLPEDVKAKRSIQARLEQQSAVLNNMAQQGQTTNNNTNTNTTNTVVQNFYQQPVQQNTYGQQGQQSLPQGPFVQPGTVNAYPYQQPYQGQIPQQPIPGQLPNQPVAGQIPQQPQGQIPEQGIPAPQEENAVDLDEVPYFDEGEI